MRSSEKMASHAFVRWTKRVLGNDNGIAAVEFAMIVPIMFFLFAGAIEFSQALTVDRRVTQSASSTADLIARAPSQGLTTGDVDTSMLIVQQLMSPYDTAPLTVNVVSVIAKTVNGNLTYVVDWSRNNSGGTPYAKGNTYNNIPAGLLAAGDSVIVSEANYNYTPLVFNYFITSAFTMSETFYLKPRNASCVSLIPANCVTG
ncbi:MAG: pilus assembly protein [Proteobacteria bacterium]|nr:pilus assembly protein [Pseudomonadota bacterium]